MKLPRDVSGIDLVKALAVLNYERSHQTGSHIRLTTLRDGEHHLTVPDHNPLRTGTLSSILRAVERHHQVERMELLRLLRL